MYKHIVDTNIVLLNPQSTVSHHTKFVVHHGIAPIGLAYIAGALTKNNLPHCLIDCVGEGLTNYIKYEGKKDLYLRGILYDDMISRFPKDVKYLCISSMYLTDWVYVRELIAKLKVEYPHAIVIIGGESPTSFWQKILLYEKDVDYCVIGEGDEILPSLLKCLEQNQNPHEITGIAFKLADGRPAYNPAESRLDNIDELKPDWSQFPLHNYFKQKTSVRAVGRSSMPIVASRGCIYKCTFCTSENKWGTRFITRSVSSVIEEVKGYKEKYDIDHICLVDLAASIDSKWFMELVKAFADAKLDLSWELSSGTRSEFLTRENLQLMKDSNFFYLTLAPDSGSDKTLMDIQKRIDMGHFNKALTDVIDLGMWVKTNFVVGMDGQTTQDIFNTYKTALKYSFRGVDDVVLYPFVPFPGSKMHDDIVARGDIKLDTKEDYENYISKVATYSIVAVKNPNIKYSTPVRNASLYVMLICFFISLLVRPTRIIMFWWRMLQMKPVGVFEVALYQYLKWYKTVLKVNLRSFLNSRAK